MNEPIKRGQWLDKASSTHLSLRDRVRTFFQLRDRRITYGANCSVKPHVEIRLADNARLELGDHVILDNYVFLQLTKPNPHLVLGNWVGIGRNCVIAIKGRTVIGDYTQIGPSCQINDQGHAFDRNDLIINQKAIIRDVAIGKDCWIGSGVRILMGVTIGDGAVIGAGSVVTSNVPAYEIWAGVPARFIKKRE